MESFVFKSLNTYITLHIKIIVIYHKYKLDMVYECFRMIKIKAMSFRRYINGKRIKEQKLMLPSPESIFSVRNGF